MRTGARQLPNSCAAVCNTAVLLVDANFLDASSTARKGQSLSRPIARQITVCFATQVLLLLLLLLLLLSFSLCHYWLVSLTIVFVFLLSLSLSFSLSLMCNEAAITHWKCAYYCFCFWPPACLSSIWVEKLLKLITTTTTTTTGVWAASCFIVFIVFQVLPKKCFLV